MREVRFAIVMYGGVSLAIYINGVVQELLGLVRATARTPDGSSFRYAEAALSGSERVYRRMAGSLDAAGQLASGEDAVQTRFVVDILSGTSAGGINAIILAKALATGQSMDGLRRLWVEDADIDRLFNDPHSFPGAAKYEDPPASLLASRRLYELALNVLDEMGTEPTQSERDAIAAGIDYEPEDRLVEQVDLAVTTTDLQGLEMPIALADRSVAEPRHRMVLKFVFATADATGSVRNDFDWRGNPMLAFAARATSSFPFAFEPVLLTDIEAAATDRYAATLERAKTYFPDHDQLVTGDGYKAFAFADGGYLDNKPFTHATDALRRRRADIPVDRKLLYIEPDPGKSPNPHNSPRPRPDLAGNVSAALFGLPRTEPIREDIAALTQRNETVERVRRVTRELELAVVAAPAGPPSGAEVQRTSYLGLRRLEVVADLTDTVVRATKVKPGSDQARAVGLLLDAGLPASGDELAEFLAHVDIRFRMRRLALLQDRLNDLIAGNAAAEALLGAADGVDLDAAAATTEAAWLRECKTALSERAKELRELGRAVRARRDDGQGSAAVLVGALAIDASEAAGMVHAADPLKAAHQCLTDSRQAAIIGFRDALYGLTGGALPANDAQARSALCVDGAATVREKLGTFLCRYWDGAPWIDETVFPLVYPDLGEVNPVEVFRVSPEDARELSPVASDAVRLAGVGFGHFGGFLDEEWRRGDLLWGQLDGADRVIAALVPDETARRSFRIEAQAHILTEQLGRQPELQGILREGGTEALAQAPSDEDYLDRFCEFYVGPAKLEAERGVKLLGRGSAVTGKVLGALAQAHRKPADPLFWLSRAGRFLWGYAELVFPSGRFLGRVPRHWAQILLAVAVVLLVVGVLLNTDGALTAGAVLGGGVLFAVATRWLLQADTRRPFLLVAGLLAVVVAAVELGLHAEEDARAVADWFGDLF